MDLKAAQRLALSKKGELIRRREERYLVPPDVADRVLAQLSAHKASRKPLRTYGVRNAYIDTPVGTWTRSRADFPTLRMRTYTDGGQSYFEMKRHLPKSKVIKNRVLMADKPTDTRPVGHTAYTRDEWESPILRVTVDHRVNADGRYLTWTVVEIKGRLPRWLAFLTPYFVRDFSKSKWLLGQWPRAQAA